MQNTYLLKLGLTIMQTYVPFQNCIGGWLNFEFFNKHINDIHIKAEKVKVSIS